MRDKLQLWVRRAATLLVSSGMLLGALAAAISSPDRACCFLKTSAGSMWSLSLAVAGMWASIKN